MGTDDQTCASRLRDLANAVHDLAKAVEALAEAHGDVDAANLAGQARREAHYLC